MIDRAMVLAAGVGSRLDPLTAQIPKPLVPVGNEPVMGHILRLLSSAGIKKVVSNLHHLPEKIQEHLGDGSQFGVSLSYLYEPELSGDAGGVRACHQKLEQGTFLVLMGDLLTDCDLGALIEAHKRKGALATIATKKVEDVSQFGVIVADPNGWIKGFQEKPQPQEALSDCASTGIYVLEPEIFKYIPAHGTFGFGKQLFPELVKAGHKILAQDINSYWSDVGTIAQYRTANFDVLNGKLKLSLTGTKMPWGYLGANTSADPAAQIAGRAIIGANCKISPGAKLTGNVIIGDNCIIEADTLLADTILWSNVHVKSNARLINCIVGSNSVISPGTYEHITAIDWSSHQLNTTAASPKR